MVRFLSPEWIAELDRAASASDSLRSATADIELTVQQVVIDAADAANGEVAWHVVVDRGRVHVASGRTAAPDVTFTQDRETAQRIGRGELSAQAAFMLGKLRVGGDVARLMTHPAAFAGLDDVFAAVRAQTEY